MKSVYLSYRLDSATSPNSRRGGARPTTTMRLEALRRASLLLAANGRDDYGRASRECSVCKGNIVITTTRPATSEAYDYTVRSQRQRALWITVPPCAS
eukprot:4480592-Pleurochrysis_carterae.AAC.2